MIDKDVIRSSSSSSLGEGERTPKRKNDAKYIMLSPQEEYLEPVKFETANKRIRHVLPQEERGFNLTVKEEEILSIETMDVDTIISLQQAVKKKNIAIVLLSVVFTFVALGLAVAIKTNSSIMIDASNSLHLFETTFEWWNNKCLRITSYAYIDTTCEGSYLDEISSWYE
jgi:hypothetical protein